MNVLFITPEVAPFSSSGVVPADSVGELARALHAAGCRVTIVSPLYAGIEDRFPLARRIRKLQVPLGGAMAEVGIAEGKFPDSDLPVFFLDHPPSFGRPGLYGDAPATDYADNHRRFHLLARGALEVAQDLSLAPDVLHLHGWQTGFVPLLLLAGRPPTLARAGVLFSLYDVSSARSFDSAILDELRLGYELFHPEGIEFHGRVSLLKAGLLYSDRVTGPSPSYVRELQLEEHGHGLHGLYRALATKIDGILPGVDATQWNPAVDHRLAARYSGDDLGGKAACKRALQTELGLPARPQVPLLAWVGPFDEPHGASLLRSAAPELLRQKLQLVVYTASRDAELAGLAASAPQSVAVTDGSGAGSDPLTHRLLAGADALLAPARHEPAGLTHLRALRYGTIPLARGCGAPRDIVVDWDQPSGTGTGFLFRDDDETAFLGATRRLLAAYAAPGRWPTLVGNALRQEHGWDRAARRTLEVYARLTA